MKKVLLLVLTLALGTSLYAKKVTRQEALQKAQLFMNNRQLTLSGKSYSRSQGIIDSQGYYIFNVENNGGFVIVAADDRIPEILGYSEKGNIDIQHLPCNMEWLLSCYEHIIDSLNAYGITKSRNTRATRVDNYTAIEPLVKTTWGQGTPYNKYCPEIGGDRCPTGCVATAMAQIINYKKWPQEATTAVDSYVTYSGINMPALEPVTFDWENMTDDDIARLMLYCGQAAKMNYELSGSGAGQPCEALKDVFGYSQSTKSWYIREFDAAHLVQTIYSELADERPVFYTGYSETKQAGHAFVVDGYKNGLFHINWGWNGETDGYFDITGLSEDVMPFLPNYFSEMIVGIEPRVQNEEHAKILVENMCAPQSSTYRQYATEDFIYPITISSIASCEYDVTCYIGYGLYDGDRLVKVLSSSEENLSLAGNGYYKRIIVGNDVPQGIFTLSLIYRRSESEEWKKALGSNQSSLIAYVGERSFYVKALADEEDGNFQDLGYQEINGVTYGLTFSYNTNWAYVLPYQLTGKYSGDITIPFTFDYDGRKFRVRDLRENENWEWPFDRCENLESLSVAIDQLFTINNCPNLSQLKLLQGTNFSIGNCPKLEEIVFPETTQQFAISGCQNLKTIRCNSIVPYAISTLSDIYECPSLTDIYFASPTPPVVYGDADIPNNPQVTIHVPKGCLPLYQNSQWKLWNIVDDNIGASLIKWGYCHNEKVSDYGITQGNKGDNIDGELAMRIAPEDLAIYKGCKITHIEVYSPSRSINDWGYEDYEYVFITKRGTDYLVKQPFQVIRGAWNDVKLDEPYTITGDELFVGFGRRGQVGVQFSDDTFVPDAAWERYMGDGNSSYVTLGEWMYAKECGVDGPSERFAHPLPLRFAIEGESVPEGVVLRELEIENSPAGSRSFMSRGSDDNGVTIKGVVRNRSLECVTSYTIDWTIDGGEKQSKTFQTMLAPNDSESITWELPSITTNGVHTIETNVSNVNENANQLEGVNMPSIECTVTNGIDSGIKNVESSIIEDNHTVYYDLQGRKGLNNRKGLFILKTSDKKIHKIVIK